MRKLFYLFTLFTLVSCFKKNHKIESIKISGSNSSLNNSINLCLEESIGYSSYYLKFITTLNNGEIINTEKTLVSSSKSDKKCFTIYLGSSFTKKHSTAEERELIAQIYNGNILKMEILIYDRYGGKEISKNIFKNL